MASTYQYPGVYIEEQPAAGAIQGVGTSTAGFIGVAEGGPIAEPLFVTSFDEFRASFGPVPGTEAQPMDGFYLWYAVRGFFENGGTSAWIVRASAGRRASLVLNDSRTSGAQPVLIVEAKEAGVPAPPIEVTVDHKTGPAVKVFRPSAAVAQAAGAQVQIGASATLSPSEAAVRFRVGDTVTVAQGGTSDTGVVAGIQGDVVLLESDLANTYTGGTIRLADPGAGTDSLRLEGGASAYGPGSVLTLAQGTTSETAVVKSIQAERIDPALTTYRVTYKAPLTGPFDLRPSAAAFNATEELFDLAVKQGTATQTRPGLSMARTHPRYVGTVLQADPFDLVTAREPAVPSSAPPPQARPAEVTEADLTGGAADDTANLTQADWQEAIDALRPIDDVNFIALPDSTEPAVQLALLTHCTQMRDRVAIFDTPPGLTPRGPGANALERAQLLQEENGFGALYYPWLHVPRIDSGLVLVPPSGHVAGIYARADAVQGVHLAPANFTVNGAIGVERKLTNEQQGPLNVANGVNVLRVLPGSGRPVVWGARTTSGQGNTAWQYVNVRRLMLFIEESIEEGIRWAVFKPNDRSLWAGLSRTIGAFLTSVWKDGALFGATPEEAFYVRIDDALNPRSEQELGRLHIEIGVKPVYPAEFIIVRIGLWQGGSEVSES